VRSLRPVDFVIAIASSLYGRPDGPNGGKTRPAASYWACGTAAAQGVARAVRPPLTPAELGWTLRRCEELKPLAYGFCTGGRRDPRQFGHLSPSWAKERGFAHREVQFSQERIERHPIFVARRREPDDRRDNLAKFTKPLVQLRQQPSKVTAFFVRMRARQSAPKVMA
jgi:hypothetical protein